MNQAGWQGPCEAPTRRSAPRLSAPAFLRYNPGMSQPARKPRGPITLFCESRRFRWATVILFAVLIGYPLSFGPACWVSSYSDFGSEFIPIVYRPLLWTFEDSEGDVDNPTATGRILQRYSEFAARTGWTWAVTTPDPMRGPFTWDWGEFMSVPSAAPLPPPAPLDE